MKTASPYHGSARQYVRETILPLLPTLDQLSPYHMQLMEYVYQTNSTKFVRNFGQFQNRGCLYELNGTSFVVGDNEMPLWFYMSCITNESPNISFWLENQIPPISDGRSSSNSYYFKKGRQRREVQFGAKGWKHSHILPAAPKGEISLEARMLRYLHPLNHFPSPKPSSFEVYPRVYRFDLGEDPRFIDIVWDEILKAHRSDKRFERILKEFSNGCMMSEFWNDPDDFSITVQLKTDHVKNSEEIPMKKTYKSSEIHLNRIKNSKGFKINKSWVSRGYIIRCEFTTGPNSGHIYEYDHDAVYYDAKSHLEGLDSFQNYGYNANSKSIPSYAKSFVKRVI